jgi:hypothetical protein
MEIMKIAGSQPTFVEMPPGEQQKRLIQTGIAAVSNSFESVPQANWIDTSVGRSGGTSQVSLPRSVQIKVETLQREISDFILGVKPHSGDESSSADLATAVASLGSVVSSIPYTGQIIAAILTTIASIIMIAAQMEQKKVEEEAKKNNAAAQSNDQSSTPNDPSNEAAGADASAMIERLTIALHTLQPLFSTGRH